MNVESTLTDLGLTLPPPPAAAGSYVATVRTGNLLYCAGTICAISGQMTHTGQVGKEQTVDGEFEDAASDSEDEDAEPSAAMLGAALGYPVTLCVPGNVTSERKQILRAYGVELILGIGR